MTISMSDLTHAFYVPGETNAIDAVHPITGLGVWSNETLEEVRLRYPGAIIETYEVIEKAAADHYRKAPVRVTAEVWDYALGVLPPVAWIRERGAETFHVSELITGDIANIYCRIGDDYYELADSVTLTHDQIVTACQQLGT